MIRSEVRKHLQSKGSITRLEALGLYGCMDITTVIRDLRAGDKSHKPMSIDTKIKYDRNGKRYARYTLRSSGNSSTVSRLRK